MQISSRSFSECQNLVRNKQDNVKKNTPQNFRGQLSFKGSYNTLTTNVIKNNGRKIFAALAGLFGYTVVKNSIEAQKETSAPTIAPAEPAKQAANVIDPMYDSDKISLIPQSVIPNSNDFHVYKKSVPQRTKAEKKTSDEILAKKIEEAKSQNKETVSIIQNVILNPNNGLERYAYYEKQVYNLNGDLLEDIVYEDGNEVTKTYDPKTGLLTSETTISKNFKGENTKTIFNEDGTVSIASYKTTDDVMTKQFEYELIDTDGTVLEKGQNKFRINSFDKLEECFKNAHCSNVIYSYDKETGKIIENGKTYEPDVVEAKKERLEILNNEIAKALKTPLVEKTVVQEEFIDKFNNEHLIPVTRYYSSDKSVVCCKSFSTYHYSVRTENADTDFDVDMETGRVIRAHSKVYNDCELSQEIRYSLGYGLI